MAGAVGLVGIGLMGTALSRRLIDAGYAVIGFDVDAGKRAEFKKMGGEPVESVAEVARRCQHILIAVMTTAQVEDVVEGEGGLITAGDAKRKPIAMGTSTCEPDRIEALAARAAARGLTFLDTPVSGTSWQVLRGDGYGLLAGDKAALETVDDILGVVYPRRQYIGPAGDATKTKLAINHILGLNRLALAEGLAFAGRLGLDLASFLDVAKKSAAYSQIMDVKGDMMVKGDFSPMSTVSQHLKDVRITLEEARKRGQALPLLSTLAEVMEACERHGDGARDNAIAIEEIRRRKA